MSNGINTVVFDLDGTLLDTLDDLCDSVNIALVKYGYPTRTREQVRADVGNGIRMLMVRSVPEGEKSARFNDVIVAFKETYGDNCTNRTKPYDGIEEMLGELVKKDYKLAIVSNKADFAVRILTEHYFGTIPHVAVGEREGVRRKPAPDMVIKALESLGSDAAHSVFVGDSDVDIETAKACGMPCISAGWGFRTENQLILAGAKIIVSKPDMLASAIFSLC